MVNVQDPVPEQGPLQPANTEREEEGVAVSVTVVPLLIAVVFVQAPDAIPEFTVQLIPPVPATVPLPVPAPVTVTVVLLKAAVTDCAAVMLTEHAPVPLQAPPHPAKAVPAGALGVRDTELPLKKFALHVRPQLMPLGLLVTVAELVPVPVLVTVSENVGAGENVAVTKVAVVPTVKLQPPVPEHAPHHPAKTEPGTAGVAVRLTAVPEPSDAEQVPGQLMPFPDTVPLPFPPTLTFTPNWATLNVAVTVCAELIETVHGAVPEQPPLQPAKVEAADEGVAVSVTADPCK